MEKQRGIKWVKKERKLSVGQIEQKKVKEKTPERVGKKEKEKQWKENSMGKWGLFVRRWERGARQRESVCVSACVFDRKKETVPKGEKESV